MKENNIEWELKRARAVTLAPYLLRYSASKLRLNYEQFPRAMGWNITENSSLTMMMNASFAIKKCPSLLLKRSDLMELQIKALRQILPNCDVLTLISSCPQLLSIDVNARVPPIIDSLRNVLPEFIDVEQFVFRSPRILLITNEGESIEQKILRRTQRLTSILGTDNDEVDLDVVPNQYTENKEEKRLDIKSQRFGITSSDKFPDSNKLSSIDENLVRSMLVSRLEVMDVVVSY